MNLAIRDAIFLAEAVTKHIRASVEDPNVDDTILQEIAEARHARALETIGFTKKLLKLASLGYDPYAWWMPFGWASVRDLTLRILGRFDFVQLKVAWGMSGLGRRSHFHDISFKTDRYKNPERRIGGDLYCWRRDER